jgi:hypothetical protein
MGLRPRILATLLLAMILPTLCQPLGARIVVRCADTAECPDITGATLTGEQLERCELICDRSGACDAPPVPEAACADTCESPCDVQTIEIEFALCVKRCVFTTIPARDLNHDAVRISAPQLLPLPIADGLLLDVIEHRSIEFGCAIEHVPIFVHRIELAPAEGLGARSPPRHALAV